MHSRDLAFVRPLPLLIPLLFTLSCGGGDSGSPTPNPVPTVTAISRDTATAGVAPFNVTLGGSDFLSGVVASFDGSPRTTDRGGSGSITIHLTAPDLATVGDHEIRVKNPDPEGGPTGPIPFHVLTPPPVPVLDSISPDTVIANGVGTLDLKAFGHAFVPGAEIRMNGNPVTTQRISDTLLKTNIIGGILGTPGSVTITVFKQGPGGGTSAGRTFTVIPHPPVPVVSSTLPSEVFIAADTISFVLRGTGFAGMDTVEFTNGLNTRRVAPTALADTAAIVPLDRTWLQSNAGLYMTVHTPGGTSIPFGVDVRDPIPTVSGVTPDTLEGGQLSDTLIVTGTGFVPGMVVQIEGNQVLSTQVLSFTSIRAIVDAGTLFLGGVRSLLVYDDNEGWGSNTIAVAIRSPIPTLDSIAGDPTDTVGSTAEHVLWGTGFRANGEVLVNGVVHTPLSISTTAALFALTAEDTDSSGTLNIAYRTPQPGGGTTDTLPLTIVAANPAPTVDSLSTDHLVDGADRVITLIGHGFLPGALATFGGDFGFTTLPATVLDSTHLMVTIPDSMLVAGTLRQLGGVNPAPTSGPSASVPVAVWSSGIRSVRSSSIGSTVGLVGDAPRGVVYVAEGTTLRAIDPDSGTVSRDLVFQGGITQMHLTPDSSSLWVSGPSGGGSSVQAYRVDLDTWAVVDSAAVPGVGGVALETFPLTNDVVAVHYADLAGGLHGTAIVDHGIVRSARDTTLRAMHLVGMIGTDTLLAVTYGTDDSLYRLFVDSSGVHRLGAFQVPNYDQVPHIVGDAILLGGALVNVTTGAFIGGLPGGANLGIPDLTHGRFLVIRDDQFSSATEAFAWTTTGTLAGSIEKFPATHAIPVGVKYGIDGLIFLDDQGGMIFVRADNIEN